MSYWVDKLVIDGYTDTHRHTHAGNNNTWRPKLASSKNMTCITAPLPFREHPCHTGWLVTLHSLQTYTHVTIHNIELELAANWEVVCVARSSFMLEFPHSAFVRGLRSPAFEERMRVAMGATGERSAGRPPYPKWHVYWFLLISTRDIKLCNNLYLSFLPQMIIIFKSQQY